MELGRPRGATKSLRIEQWPIARMWFALLHQRFTGIVQLDQPDASRPTESAGSRTVWLEGGMPLYTDWTSQAVLGEVLVEAGLLSADGLAQALTVMAREGGMLGNVLLRLELVQPSALTEGLKRQCMRKLVDMFRLRDGEVLVTAGAYDVPAGIGKVDVLELLSLGVSAHYDLARVEQEMGAALHGPLAATNAVQRYLTHFHFRPSDDAAIAALARPTTFDELARCPGLSRPRAAQIVYTLFVSQMLRVGAAAQIVDPSAAPARRSTPVEHARTTPRRSTPVFTAADAPLPPRRSTASELPQPAPAPAPTPEDPDSNADAFIAALETLEQKIATNVHAFGLLGIDLAGGKREIKRAFSELSRRFHPDALQSRGLGYLRLRVSRVFAALSEAQTMLSDPEARENLKSAIEKGVSATSGADATAMARVAFESDLLARDGDKYLRAGRLDRALELYERAVELTPEEPDLRAAIAWCSYGVSPRTREDGLFAEKTLAGILRDAPNIARAHYFRGLILKDLGAIDPAIAALSRAIEMDPRLIDAERHARALRAAKQEAQSKGKGFGGLFGGKKT
jgi:tetratricopeptide (TPR) repeat protein